MTREDSRIRLLVVDDEQSIRRLCMTVGGGLGYLCSEAESAEAVLAQIPAALPDIVIADLRLPNLSGADLLRQIKSRLPTTEVVIMTGHGSIESAVEAMKSGAYDYIQKPFRVEELRMLLRRMEEKIRLVQENKVLRERVETDQQLDGIIGESANIREVLRMIGRLKDTWTPVLICGESGTGKELVARALHDLGPRSEGPWVSINCAALPESLLESELFGHDRGAFTGASSRHAGRFEQAHGGTLLLDEISEIQPGLQAKLLRALQEREFFRLGGTEPVRVDVRVVATSNRDMRAMVERGEFRADLFYRLNVLALRLPPLRERPGDIPLLAASFLKRAGLETGRELTAISPGALEMLCAHPWPGNVRELYNCIERAAVFAKGPVLESADFALEPASPVRRDVFDLGELERDAIVAALQATGGHRERTARILGISVRTLRNKLSQYRESGLLAAQNLPPEAANFASVAAPRLPALLRPAA